MRKRAAVLLAVVLCNVMVAAPFRKKKNQTSDAPPQPLPVPDQIVAVSDGSFAFRSLRLVQELTLVYLAGTVKNETSHLWEDVVFEFRAIDADGGTERLGLVICPSFPAGGECSLALTVGPGMLISMSPKLVSAFSGGAGSTVRMSFFQARGYYVPNYSFSLQRPIRSDKLAFEDPTIAFAAQMVREGIRIALLNKTDQPIKIDWNSVSYVDQTGKANSVSHQGIKYTDAASQKPPTIIPPGARHEDTIIPATNIHFANEWKIDPILPMGALSGEVVGKTFSLFMPLDVGGRVQNYNFGFKIESAN